MPPALRNTIRSRAVAVLAALAAAGCRGAGGAAPGPPSVYDLFCKQRPAARAVPDPGLPRLNTAGVNERDYVYSRVYTTEIPFERLRVDNIAVYRERTLASSRARGDSEIVATVRRDSAVYGALNELLKSPPVSWDPGETLRPLVERPASVDALLARTGILSRFITMVHDTAVADCVAQVYRYSARFGVLRNPLLVLPEAARREYERQVVTIIAEKIHMLVTRGDTVTISTKEIFDRLYGDPAFRRRMQALLAAGDTSYLPYIGKAGRFFVQMLTEPTTRLFPFSSGAYAMSDDMAYTVQAVVDQLIERTSAGSHYAVITRGFADANVIRAPVRYVGAATLDLARDEVAPYRAGTLRQAALATNLELSIARGHAGAEQMSRMLRERDGTAAGRFTFFYSGGGEVPGPVQDSYRRIDIVIGRLTGVDGR
jgi:hypothetical protein